MFTVMQEAAIRSAIEYECVRQHVGEDRQAFLYSAYARAVVLSDLGVPPQPGQVLQLAGELEPSNGGKLRTTPVTFSDGGYSTPPQQVPHVYYSLFENIRDFMGEEPDVRYWIKEFLICHPFVDGNGRGAFLLYNWMRGSLRTPAQLPYFFGEAPA